MLFYCFVNRFYTIYKKMCINCTIRREFGSNIDAACGQLRGKTKHQENEK